MRGRQEPCDPRRDRGEPQKSWPHTDHHGVDPSTSRFPSIARLWVGEHCGYFEKSDKGKFLLNERVKGKRGYEGKRKREILLLKERDGKTILVIRRRFT